MMAIYRSCSVRRRSSRTWIPMTAITLTATTTYSSVRITCWGSQHLPEVFCTSRRGHHRSVWIAYMGHRIGHSLTSSLDLILIIMMWRRAIRASHPWPPSCIPRAVKECWMEPLIPLLSLRFLLLRVCFRFSSMAATVLLISSSSPNNRNGKPNWSCFLLHISYICVRTLPWRFTSWPLLIWSMILHIFSITELRGASHFSCWVICPTDIHSVVKH